MSGYRDFVIPKKNGKPRLISAPSPELKKTQKYLLNGLYRIHRRLVLSMNLKDIQHGFIPGKNCVTAAKKHIGFKYTTQLDISDFFNSCFLDLHFKDSNGIFKENFYKKYMKSLFHNEGYCAQGFVTSPILANIASLDAILLVKNRLELLFENYKTESNSNLKKFAFTIYADDIQISYNQKYLKKDIINIVESSFLEYKFEINKRKTRTRVSDCGFRKILGINVGETEIRGTRKTMRKIRAANHQGNFHSKGGLIAWSNCNKPKKLNTVI